MPIIVETFDEKYRKYQEDLIQSTFQGNYSLEARKIFEKKIPNIFPHHTLTTSIERVLETFKTGELVFSSNTVSWYERKNEELQGEREDKFNEKNQAEYKTEVTRDFLINFFATMYPQKASPEFLTKLETAAKKDLLVLSKILLNSLPLSELEKSLKTVNRQKRMEPSTIRRIKVEGMIKIIQQRGGIQVVLKPQFIEQQTILEDSKNNNIKSIIIPEGKIQLENIEILHALGNAEREVISSLL